jgi:hypothetical protein
MTFAPTATIHTHSAVDTGTYNSAAHLYSGDNTTGMGIVHYRIRLGHAEYRVGHFANATLVPACQDADGGKLTITNIGNGGMILQPWLHQKTAPVAE